MAKEEDVELEVMQTVSSAIKRVDPRTGMRVVRWIAERIANQLKDQPEVLSQKDMFFSGLPVFGSPDEGKDFKDLPALYDAANPTRDADKALVVGYWMQEYEKSENFYGQHVNAKLKHLGHGVGNITRAFEFLKNETPRLVQQVEKGGTTQQARKKFRLTVEGVKKVKTMIAQRSATTSA